MLLNYESLPMQLSYSIGIPERLAIQRAYGHVQKRLIIEGAVVWAIGLVAVSMWRNLQLIGIKQTKG